ncbi:hypothetical protein E5288_WYG020988 [Bos mutus]|uniref:SLP adapter and CSK-interacting membrane protein n=1 Tax=Bos mutus TaxID=72004 RepID=A0A6B0S9W8_9CETA|nr:hypothetical protein [Bos mutus]
MAPQPLTSGPPATQDLNAMDWWKDHFWIILAVAIIFTSVSLGTILFCVCRCLFRPGKKWEISKSLKQKQRDEETMYENVTEQFSVQLPPLPPRDMLSPGVASPQETPSRPTPAAYSSKIIILKQTFLPFGKQKTVHRAYFKNNQEWLKFNNIQDKQYHILPARFLSLSDWEAETPVHYATPNDTSRERAAVQLYECPNGVTKA